MNAKMLYLVLAVVIFALGATALYVLKPIVSRAAGDLPVGFPDDGFSHATFEQLLERYVDESGEVDYEGWHGDKASRAELGSYLAAVAAYSPDSEPTRFPENGDVVAYWMYAYNAFVIGAILERWPLESVTDVKAPIELVRGLGFFYKLKFVTGGKSYSLYEIEHEKVLKNAADARAHFVLNCGSGSCPIIRPKLPTGAQLDPFLAEAAAKFVESSKNVLIDHKEKTITLSKIFDWYQDDFLNELRRQGKPTKDGLAAYLRTIAREETLEGLKRARGYEVKFFDYDWSLNKAKK